MRNGLDVFTYEGALVETLPKELGMLSTEERVPDVAVPALTLAQARPRRNVKLPVHLGTTAQSTVQHTNAPRLQVAAAARDLATPAAQAPARVQVIIPQEIWPRSGTSAQRIMAKVGQVRS